jgi:hypothetical protein
MANLIELAGITGTLVASVLISTLIGRLTLEVFFRMITLDQRVPASPAPTDPSQLQGMK